MPTTCECNTCKDYQKKVDVYAKEFAINVVLIIRFHVVVGAPKCQKIIMKKSQNVLLTHLA